MLALCSLISFAAGASIAAFAARSLPRQATYELVGGLLLIAGCVMVGAGLPIFR